MWTEVTKPSLPLLDPSSLNLEEKNFGFRGECEAFGMKEDIPTPSSSLCTNESTKSTSFSQIPYTGRCLTLSRFYLDLVDEEPGGGGRQWSI